MARAFNGSGDKITVSSVSLGTVHTIAFRLQWLDSADGVVLGGADSGGGFVQYMPYVDGTNIYYRADNTTGPVFVAHGGFSAGLVYEIVIVRDGASVSFFKNGIQIGTTQTLVGSTAQFFTTIGNLSGGGLAATMNLSDVGLWSRAFALGDVKRYSAGFDPSRFRNGGLHYWPLDGKSGPEIDIWRGNHGALTGTVPAKFRALRPQMVDRDTSFTGTSPPPSYIGARYQMIGAGIQQFSGGRAA